MRSIAIELGNLVLPLGLFGVAGLMLTNRRVTTLVGAGSVLSLVLEIHVA